MTTDLLPRPATSRLLQSLVPLLAIIFGIGYLASVCFSYVSAATAGSVTTQAGSVGGTQRTGTAAPPTPPAQTSAPYPTIQGFKGGRECSREGNGAWAAVAVNSTTSCPFANNVRQAYIQAGLNGADGTVEAWSPTTRLSYTLTCSGIQPAVCTGGRNANIQIYGGPYVAGE